jgi:hypothetical protein
MSRGAVCDKRARRATPASFAGSVPFGRSTVNPCATLYDLHSSRAHLTGTPKRQFLPSENDDDIALGRSRCTVVCKSPRIALQPLSHLTYEMRISAKISSQKSLNRLALCRLVETGRSVPQYLRGQRPQLLGATLRCRAVPVRDSAPCCYLPVLLLNPFIHVGI